MLPIEPWQFCTLCTLTRAAASRARVSLPIQPTTACWRYSALRMASIGPPASDKGWGERAVSTLGSNRCNSTLLPHVSYGTGKRSGNDGWGYLEQSPSKACSAGPLVTPEIFSTSRTSLAGSAHLSSLTADQSARVLPRIWVRPLPPRAASRLSGLARRLRCFVPKQRPCGVSGRPRSGSGTYASK